jgi:hypothetical protein
MRPTGWQLYCNPEFFVEQLTLAGVPNAHEKVVGVMKLLIEQVSMERHHKRNVAERVTNEQSEFRSTAFKRDGKRYDKKARLRIHKRVGQLNRMIIQSQQFVARQRIVIDRKIAQWPDLDIGDKVLKRTAKLDFANKIYAKRIRLSKPKTHVMR